jgi:ATPase AAA family
MLFYAVEVKDLRNMMPDRSVQFDRVNAEKINSDLRSVFMERNMGKVSEFALIYEVDNDVMRIALALGENRIAYAYETLQNTFSKAPYHLAVQIGEMLEITSAEFFRRCAEADHTGGLIRYTLPEYFEEWSEGCDPDDFRITAGLCDSEPRGEEAAVHRAKQLLMGEAFIEEIRRIYAQDNHRTLIEHPVHYKLNVADAACAEPAVRLLLECLYENGRLPGCRYDILTRCNESWGVADKISQLLAQSEGATVVLSFADLARESGANSALLRDKEVFDSLCTGIKAHRRKTLFIFVTDRSGADECRRLTNVVGEELHILDLPESRRSRAQAEAYLTALIKGSDYAAFAEDGDYILPDQQNGYTAEDVHRVFDAWHKQALLRAYPAYRTQYAEELCTARYDKTQTVYDEFNAMVGLGEVKEIVRNLIAAHKMRKLRASWGITDEGAARHMVFTGNPGTAKTTTARLIARILEEEGVLPRCPLVECGRADLVGRYVGWTAPKVRKKFAQAHGGILFIDEAYALMEEHRTFGDEAINTIVQEMENQREDVIVILAGYPEKMKELLLHNEGLKSRVGFRLHFPDYTPAELDGILSQIGHKSGYTMTDAARRKCGAIFTAAVKDKNFGNGRFVRNLLEQAILRQSRRLLERGGRIVREVGLTLDAEDFEAPALDRVEKPGIGFCRTA